MPARQVPAQRIAVVLAVLAVLAGVGCSGPRTRHSDDAPPGPVAGSGPGPGVSQAPVTVLGSVTRKPCSLITRAEAEKAAGQALGAPLESPDPAECTFATSDSTASVVLDLGTWAGITKVLGSVRTGNGTGLQKVAVAGVGNEAVALSGRGGTPILYVRKGDKGFVLSISGPEVDHLPDGGLARAKALAVTIAARL